MIPVCEPVFLGNEKKYVMDCLDTGWISSLGKYVGLFEEKFTGYVGTEHGVACCSGTAGLHTALSVLGVGAGDEVIIPNFTIIVSANVVMRTGAKPVLVDVEPDTWCIDPARIERAISPKTKAIMVVHMYGHPCDMGPIMELAKRHQLFVVEDCCQSHGATYEGQMTGSFGEFGVFSFYGNKIITSGEGGMLCTSSGNLAKRARIFCDNGFQIPRFIHEVSGMNYRLTNVQAAIGLAQTEKIEYAVERKREIAARYMELLKECPNLTLPVERPNAKNVYWMFCVLVGEGFGRTKDEVMVELKKKGVDSRSFFYPMSQQPVLNGDAPNLPDLSGEHSVSDRLAEQGLYLPSGLGLSDEQIGFCAESLLSLQR